MQDEDWDDGFLANLFEAEADALRRRTEQHASPSGRGANCAEPRDVGATTPGGSLWRYPDETAAPRPRESQSSAMPGAPSATVLPSSPNSASVVDAWGSEGGFMPEQGGRAGCDDAAETAGTPRAGAGLCGGDGDRDDDDDGEDYGERLSETDAAMDIDQPPWGDEEGDGGGGDCDDRGAGAEGAWDDGDGLFWEQPKGGGEGQHLREQNGGGAGAVGQWQGGRGGQPQAQLQQKDIRQWFGGVPQPAPVPKRLVAADIRSFFGGGQGAGGGPRPAVFQPQQATGGGGGAGKRQRRGGVDAYGNKEAQPPAQPRPCPWYKKVTGTCIAVDAFCFGPVPGIRAYVLTHFHSDHYMGLGPSWTAGPIYCTPTTARLVMKRLRVRQEWLRLVPLHSPVVVEGSRLTFFDANHCPGAAVVTITPAGRPRPLAVHTGDFRAGAELLARPEMAAYRGCDTLYLDTTYCDERYAFPPQEDVLRAGAAAALQAMRAAPRTLIVVGAYAIGKERVYLSIAQALGCRIFVDTSRRNLLECMEWPELQERLTDRPDDTPLHVIPIGQLNAKGLLAYLAKRRGPFDRVLGFRPTGWTHGSQGPCQGPGRGGAMVYPLPYSEHSSVEELKQFVQMVRPGKVIPTVNVGSPEKRALMTGLFQRWLSER